MAIRFKPEGGGEAITTGICERNLNLLAHAQSIELDIGSRCGGHGVCGGDRIRLPVGAEGKFSPIRDAEREHLSEQELAEGFRLACQCFPESGELDLAVVLSPRPPA
jgi:ferredoxin